MMAKASNVFQVGGWVEVSIVILSVNLRANSGPQLPPGALVCKLDWIRDDRRRFEGSTYCRRKTELHESGARDERAARSRARCPDAGAYGTALRRQYVRHFF